MKIELLTRENITREVLDILAQLSSTKSLTLAKARNILDKQIKANHFTFIGSVDNKVVAVGSIVIMHKFIHDGKKMGQIEDLAVHKDYHKQGYGREMVLFLKKIARKHKAYKLILDCDRGVVEFYEKLKFRPYHTQLRIDLIYAK